MAKFKYTKPMTLRESTSLLANAKNLEQQAAGWKLFLWFVFFACLWGYVAISFIGWLLT
jgi:hypothetical protein